PRAAAQSPPPAEAATPVKLEYAFERLHGKTALYELETEQVVSQEVRGLQAGRENQPEALRGEVRTRVVELQAWRCSRGEEGGGRIEIEVGQVVVTLEEQGKRARTFTSDRPRRAPERLRPLLEKAGHKLTLVVSRNGALRAVEGVEQGAARE